MSDTPNDERRLRATEAQMRRALGLNEQPSTPGYSPPPASTGGGPAHPRRRRFVRDGDVAVTVLRDHDDGAGRNKLDAARQALSEQTAAREHAEQLLQEALVTIQDIQTKLGHERIAKDEAVQRSGNERQAIQEELAVERAARHQVEQERDLAIAACQEAEERLRDIVPAQEAERPSAVAARGKPAGKAGTARAMALSRSPFDGDRDVGARSLTAPHTAGMPPLVTDAVKTATAMKPSRGRGRPRKASQGETAFVEWWKPGWRERFR